MCSNLKEKVENVAESTCHHLYHLHNVCFPVNSLKCEKIVSACVIVESMKVAENWMEEVGHHELVCVMEAVRSHFKACVIDSERCERYQPNLKSINDMFKRKCTVLDILSKLKKWLHEYSSISNSSCKFEP